MVKGEIHVGQYEDGSSPMVIVKFDTTSSFPNLRRNIQIEREYSGEPGPSIDAAFALELCEAIKTAALYIERANPNSKGE